MKFCVLAYKIHSLSHVTSEPASQTQHPRKSPMVVIATLQLSLSQFGVQVELISTEETLYGTTPIFSPYFSSVCLTPLACCSVFTDVEENKESQQDRDEYKLHVPLVAILGSAPDVIFLLSFF